MAANRKNSKIVIDLGSPRLVNPSGNQTNSKRAFNVYLQKQKQTLLRSLKNLPGSRRGKLAGSGVSQDLRTPRAASEDKDAPPLSSGQPASRVLTVARKCDDLSARNCKLSAGSGCEDSAMRAYFS